MSGRHGVAHDARQERLDAVTSGDHNAVSTIRAVLDRSVCFSDERPVADVLCLASRYDSQSDRRFRSELVGGLRVRFSAVLPSRQDVAESGNGSSRAVAHCAGVAGANLVAVTSRDGGRSPSASSPVSGVVDRPERDVPSAVRQRHSSPFRMADLRARWRSQGFSEDAAGILASSWAAGSCKQYDSALRKWHCWCLSQQVDPLSPDVKDVANFLVSLFRSGLKYNTIAVAKAAICTVLESGGFCSDLSNDARLKRVMKGLFRVVPPLPKHATTWDVAVVLATVQSWGQNASLTNKLLSFKVTVLLALCSPKRVSELFSLRLSCMTVQSDLIVFTLPGMTKNRGLGPAHRAEYARFSDPLLCPIDVVQHYLERSQSWRVANDRLLLSYVGKHLPVSAATVARWICSVLTLSGISGRFTAHSTRSASTSKAAHAGLAAPQILAAANWSPGSASFARFYHKPIERSFSAVVLAGESA